MKRAKLPGSVRKAGAVVVRKLDVRLAFVEGADPFGIILEAAQRLAAGEALHVVLDFDPQTLQAFMRSLGWVAHTSHSDDFFHVWFHRSQTPVRSAPERLQAPVLLDVRGLASPQPMIAILEKLVDLGPGAQLLVCDDREPGLLYEKLALRGYDARTEMRGRGDYLLHIAPAWVFEL
jgi:uncharacterized protein (DUF2249 family)